MDNNQEFIKIRVTYIYLNDKEYFYEEKTSSLWDFKTQKYIGKLDWETEEILTDDNYFSR